MGHNRRRDMTVNPGVGRARWQSGEAERNSFIPPLCCDVMPSPEGLDVRRIALAHRAVDSKLLAMLVEPFPHCIAGVGAIAACKVGRTAVAISAGRYAASVERITAVSLETGSNPLSIVIAKCAQDSPVNAVGIHRMSEIIEEFPKIPVHAANDIFLGQQAQARRCCLVFPGEIAGGIPLRPRTLIDAPEIFVDLIDTPCAWGSGLSRTRSGLSGARSGLSRVRSGLSGARSGLSRIRSGLGRIRSGLSGVRRGLSAIRSGLSGTRSGLGRIRSGLSGMLGVLSLLLGF